ncbi:MAG TPA: transglutaminaseTgpA domain-containing protein [Pantanalinema sp.]
MARRAFALLDPTDPLLGLRLASAASLSVGMLALYSVNPNGWYLAGVALCLAGCWFSHREKGKSSRWVKTGLAVGMLYLLWRFLQELVLNLQDTRLPLAELLLWLQVLNAYDLPRRHNLRIAQMVGAILLVATATLSLDMTFGIFLLAYAAVGLWWGQQDMASELGVRAPFAGHAARRYWRGALGAVMLLGMILFLVVPRSEGGFIKQLPVSTMISLPSHLDPRVRNPAYPVGKGSGEGGKVNPQAYYGFAEELDLNYRGHLSDAIALKVRSPRRQYWRGMAYDRYDGKSWRMFAPNDVSTMSIGSLPFELGGDRYGHDSGTSGIVTFFVAKDQTNLVLMPERARYLYFPSSILFRDVNGALRSPLALESDLYYTAVVDLAGYRTEWLKNARLLSSREERLLAPYLEVPKSLTPRTRALARRVAGDAPDPYTALKRLEGYLRTNYRYNLNIPPFPEGADTVDYFLFEQPGREAYCEHFATSLTLMGRELGIPTRLVTGYLPGNYNPFTGLYEVKTSDAHAWVEAFFPGVGWAAFDPTPGNGDPMLLSQQEAQLPWRELLGWLRGGLGVAIALGAAFASLGAVVWWLGRPRPGAELAPTRAYRRFVALVAREGIPVREGDTPGEVLFRLRQEPAWEAIGPEAEAFVRAYEAARFGDADGAALEGRVEAIASLLRDHHKRSSSSNRV